MDEQGVENAAILMMALGEEEAAQVLRHLAPKEVQQLGQTIAKLKSVPRERVAEVIEKFAEDASDHHALVPDTDAYVRRVLQRALGDDRSSLLIDRILKGPRADGIENLRWMEPPAVAELLSVEHPQIVAAILAHLEAEHASAVLKLLDDALRHDVVWRIATLDSIQPSAMRDLNDMLTKVLAGAGTARPAPLGGSKVAAALLNGMGGGMDTAVLDHIREGDPDLAQLIADDMFIFDDLIKLDDKGVQTMLKEVQSDALVVALKGAPPALSDKIFKNMSSRAAETLREDLEAKGPVRLSEVEAQQKEILKTVRRLVDEGQITLASGSSEKFL